MNAARTVVVKLTESEYEALAGAMDTADNADDGRAPWTDWMEKRRRARTRAWKKIVAAWGTP